MPDGRTDDLLRHHRTIRAASRGKNMLSLPQNAAKGACRQDLLRERTGTCSLLQHVKCDYRRLLTGMLVSRRRI